MQLDQLLNCQEPITRSLGNEIHDEHLFIVIHQAYELWFKHLNYELDSIRNLLGGKVIETLMHYLKGSGMLLHI